MKFKIALFLLALLTGGGLWLWGQRSVGVNNQVKGVRTETHANKPNELGLVWVSSSNKGGSVVTIGTVNQPQILTSESENVSLACRINNTRLAYITKDSSYYKLWLWTTDKPDSKFISATRQQPFELICDQLGNRVLYLAYDGSSRVLYQVDLATGTTRQIDSVIGRPAFDQTGQRLIYAKSDGLYYREINRSGELSQPLQVVAGEVAAAVFTQSNTAVIYVIKEDKNYVLYQTDWRSQTTERLTSFDIGQTDLKWSLDISDNGETILYSYYPHDSIWQSTVGTIGVDGTNQQVLQTDIGRSAWMPNDSLIVYEKRHFGSENISIDLWQMSALGSDREAIVGLGQNSLAGYPVIDPTSDDSSL